MVVVMVVMVAVLSLVESAGEQRELPESDEKLDDLGDDDRNGRGRTIKGEEK